jgi:hypothetical protein
MTSRRKTEPTSFINVDLEISSESDLSELVNHLAKDLCLLHHSQAEGKHHASFEVRPSTSTDNPNEFIAVFHTVISSLPSPLRPIWDNCQRRLFDIGIQGGWKPNIYTIPLTANCISQLAELQTECLVTIYGTATARKIFRRA